jgi:hypothetical protein
MRHEEFTDICRSAESGEDQRVQNLDLLYVGKVVACDLDRDKVRVEAFGNRFDWDADRIRSVKRDISPLGPPTHV